MDGCAQLTALDLDGVPALRTLSMRACPALLLLKVRCRRLTRLQLGHLPMIRWGDGGGISWGTCPCGEPAPHRLRAQPGGSCPS